MTGTLLDWVSREGSEDTVTSEVRPEQHTGVSTQRRVAEGGANREAEQDHAGCTLGMGGVSVPRRKGQTTGNER